MVPGRRKLVQTFFGCALFLAPLLAQEEAPNFYSGYVVDLPSGKVSVERSILGQPPETRSFILTKSTKVEGKLKLKARVTVQFEASDQGDVALHIIVRTGSNKGGLN